MPPPTGDRRVGSAVVEGIIGRYLSVFVPFLATVVIAHFVVRSSGVWQLERLGLGSLASPHLLRRVLLATLGAMTIIVSADALTGGDLFLAPSPRSLLLIGAIILALVSARFAARAAEPLLRLVRGRPGSQAAASLVSSGSATFTILTGISPSRTARRMRGS